MSISSATEPPYNEFYDHRLSSKHSETATAARRTPSYADTSGFFQSLFAPFQSCCLNRRGFGAGAAENNLTAAFPAILDARHVETESDGTSRSSVVVVGHRGAAVLKQRGPKITAAGSSGEVCLRAALQARGLRWASDLGSTATIDAMAQWCVSSPLEDVVFTNPSWLGLTQGERELVALDWCRRMELSERMNAPTMSQIISSVELQTMIPAPPHTIQTATQQLDPYAVVVCARQCCVPIRSASAVV